MQYRKRRLKGIARRSIIFIWQKQVMFLVITLFTSYYYTPYITVPLYLLVLGVEFFELYISRRVIEWESQLEKEDEDDINAVKFARWFTVFAAINAALVSVLMFSLARYEGTVVHFTPLTLLFLASMYAVVNYHQLLSALVARLILFGATILFIPLYDIWLTSPALNSHLWLELATVLCILYFIFDCSRSILRLYMQNLGQLYELEHQRNRAENLYNLQSQFVSIISHELRTPLTSIKGSLGLIEGGQAGEIPPKAKNLVSIANRNSIRLVALINDLLDVQKFESGKMTLDISPVNITQLVKEAVEANKNYKSAMNVKFRTFGLENAVYVNADYDRLMQVMANILSNAVKFSETGGEVAVSLEDDASKVRISIQDHGEGIPEEARDKVFAQFEQVDGSTQRKTGGTGLGMYITKKIMDGHVGSINFSSEVGKGTTFYIELAVTDPSR